MKRQSIMNTYKELVAVKNTPYSNTSEINALLPDQAVMDYTFKHGRREGLLYNNRIFSGYINPSQKRKDEYDANRTWILNNFPK